MVVDKKKLFLDACSKVLGPYQMTYVAGEAEEKVDCQFENQLLVLIGVTGQWRGQVLFNMERNTALKVASQMMGGMEVNGFDDLTKSALSELVNMILGNVATLLFTEGIEVDITPPSLVMGNRITFSPQHPALTIPLDLSGGGVIEINIILKHE